MFMLLLKFKQFVFTEASFSSLSDIHGSWVVIKSILLGQADIQQGITTHRLVRLLMDLATVCDLNLKTASIDAIGYFNFLTQNSLHATLWLL